MQKAHKSLNANKQDAVFVCISLYTTVAHNAAQNSSDILPLIFQTVITHWSYVVYWRGGNNTHS